ncbi:MAG: nickel/cobalt transporter [Acidimicrobiales bacterium]
MCVERQPVLRTARALAAVAVLAVVLLGTAGPADAHPLGNFTVNTYSGVVVRTDAVEVRFVLDMAEIPAFQTRSEIDGNGDGATDGAELAAFRRSRCDDIRANVRLSVDDRDAPVTVRATTLSFPMGQAGLTTLRLTCSLAAAADLSAGGTVSYTSANYVDRTGWREISAAGDRVTLAGRLLRATSVSAELTAYPENLLQAPLDERAVRFTVTPGGPPLAAAAPGERSPSSPLPRGVDRATKAFTSFVARQRLTLGFGLVAVGLSTLLGAVHAFAPGHGKTVMAAYLVGQNGSMRQAALIAGTVTLTHTVGVLVLGIAISASTIVAPERLYPYLGLASGLMLAAIGAGLLIRAWRQRPTRPAADHDHHAHDEDGAGHDHGGHAHDDHAHDDHAHDHVAIPHSHGGRFHSHAPVDTSRPLTLGSMLAIGFVGGFLPSPSAVVVILGAIALHRTWFGVVLVLAYGVGMALTLMGAGLVLLKTWGALERRGLDSSWRDRLLVFNRVLPTLTGAVIVTVGLVLAAQAFTKV